MSDFDLHVEDSDELGPGSDLVISMFAMAMFVMALIGTGIGQDPVPPGATPAEAEHTQAQAILGRAVERAERAERTIRTEQDAVAGLRAELARTRSSASASAALAASLQQDFDATRRQRDDASQDVASVRRELAAARQQRDAAEAAAASASARNAELAQRLAAVPAKPGTGPGRTNRITLLGSSVFGSNEATLLEDARRQLVEGLPKLLQAVTDGGANQITVAGASSPEARPASLNLAGSKDAADSNIDLSAARALAVAHFLNLRGVLYRCIVVQGLGISRTTLPPGQDGLPPRDASANPERFAAERRVDVFAEKDGDSTCSSAGLQAALARTANSDRPRTKVTGLVSGFTTEGWPVVGQQALRLQGVRITQPGMLPAFKAWFGDTPVDCSQSEQGGYRCYYYRTDGWHDLGQAMISNRLAGATQDAPGSYRNSQPLAEPHR